MTLTLAKYLSWHQMFQRNNGKKFPFKANLRHFILAKKKILCTFLFGNKILFSWPTTLCSVYNLHCPKTGIRWYFWQIIQITKFDMILWYSKMLTNFFYYRCDFRFIQIIDKFWCFSFCGSLRVVLTRAGYPSSFIHTKSL